MTRSYQNYLKKSLHPRTLIRLIAHDFPYCSWFVQTNSEETWLTAGMKIVNFQLNKLWTYKLWRSVCTRTAFL
jgi:hypothetical protein